MSRVVFASRVFDATVGGVPDASALFANFSAFFSRTANERDARVLSGFLLRDALEKRVLIKVRGHPVEEILHVGGDVSNASRAQDVGVFSEEGRVDDAKAVLGLLKVRIREEEEDFVELAFVEKVGEELHGVGLDD